MRVNARTTTTTTITTTVWTYATKATYPGAGVTAMFPIEFEPLPLVI